MCATVVFPIVMINVQVENFSSLIDIFKIQPQAIKLLPFFQRKTEIGLVVNHRHADLPLGQWETTPGQFCHRLNIGPGICNRKQGHGIRFTYHGFPYSRMNHFPFWNGLGAGIQHGKQEHSQKRNFSTVHLGDHCIMIDLVINKLR